MSKSRYRVTYSLNSPWINDAGLNNQVACGELGHEIDSSIPQSYIGPTN